MRGLNIMKGFSTLNFERDPDHLSNEQLLVGPPIPITIDMVKKAISKMKLGKDAGPPGIVKVWMVFTIHLKFSLLFNSLKFWVIH